MKDWTRLLSLCAILFYASSTYAEDGKKIDGCNCGCVVTGSCKCKNCNEHTADPNYTAPKVEAPLAPGVIKCLSGRLIKPGPNRTWIYADEDTQPKVTFSPQTTTTTSTGTVCVNGVCYPAGTTFTTPVQPSYQQLLYSTDPITGVTTLQGTCANGQCTPATSTSVSRRRIFRR